MAKEFNLETLKSGISFPQIGSKFNVIADYESATGVTFKAGDEVTAQSKPFQHITKTRSYGAIIVKQGTRRVIIPLYNLKQISETPPPSEGEVPACDCTHTQACAICAEEKEIDWSLIEVDTKKLAAKPAAVILITVTSPIPLEKTVGYQVAMTFKSFIDPKCTEHMEIVKDMARTINKNIKSYIGRFAVLGKTSSGEKYWNEFIGQFESAPQNLNDYTFSGRDIFRIAKKVKTIYENIETEIVYL